MKYFTIWLYVLITILICACKNINEDPGKGSLPLGEYIIAYNVLVDGENDDYDIFTMNMDGSNKRNITNDPDVAWAYHSDGDQIFFLSDRDTTGRVLQLHAMNSEGSQLKRISEVRMRDGWMGTRDNGRELVVVPQSAIGGWLYLLGIEGEVKDSINTGIPFASDPVFSPDGSKIAFIGKNKASKRDPDFEAEIYVIKVDGTGLTQLSHYPPSDTTAEWYAYKAGPPRWHPTEDLISFQSKRNGKYSLYGVSEGLKEWRLTDNLQEEGWHSWSPDGNWLAIEIFNDEQTQFHIGLMNWKTKEMKILTDTTYQYQQAPVIVEMSN